MIVDFGSVPTGNHVLANIGPVALTVTVGVAETADVRAGNTPLDWPPLTTISAGTLTTAGAVRVGNGVAATLDGARAEARLLDLGAVDELEAHRVAERLGDDRHANRVLALDVGVDDGLAARLAGGPLLLRRQLQIDGGALQVGEQPLGEVPVALHPARDHAHRIEDVGRGLVGATDKGNGS